MEAIMCVNIKKARNFVKGRNETFLAVRIWVWGIGFSVFTIFSLVFLEEFI
jgi:hypothetical protein